VHVIDDATVAIPERPGNRRIDGYLNVLQRPRFGPGSSPTHRTSTR
jgi:hypothetical protein